MSHPTLDDALAALHRLTGSQMDFFAIDLEPAPDGAVLWVRLGGLAAALPERLARLRGLVGGGDTQSVADGADVVQWRAAREFMWRPGDSALVKVPVTPGRIARLEADLSGLTLRRYGAGGQVAWLAWPPAALDELDAALKALDLSGLLVLGRPGAARSARLGVRPGESFERRVKVALDPGPRFVEV